MLKTIWLKWKAIAKVISNFQAKLILTLIYFIFVTPIAILFKIIFDPLYIRSHKKTYWIKRNPEDTTISQARRQF